METETHTEEQVQTEEVKQEAVQEEKPKKRIRLSVVTAQWLWYAEKYPNRPIELVMALK